MARPNADAALMAALEAGWQRQSVSGTAVCPSNKRSSSNNSVKLLSMCGGAQADRLPVATPAFN